MENNNYKSRLKNRKTEYNPEAWTQMSAMLDTIPLKKEEEKKRRFFYLFFVFLFLIISYFGTRFYFTQKRNDINSIPKKENIVENKIQDATPEANEENLESITSAQKSNLDRDYLLEKEIIEKKNFASTNTEHKKELENAIKLKNGNETGKIENKKELKDITTSEKDTLMGVPFLAIIPFDSLAINQPENLSNKKTPAIKLPKYSRFYLTTQAGIAWFNGNQGYHLGSGIFWDINKLIGLESGIAFSTGSDKNRQIESTIEKESQVDLNLLFHLNFLRSYNQKISVELGGGYTYYWGNRIVDTTPSMVDRRKSKGLNFQGGLSYTYYTRRNHAFGIKAGVISYDDAVNYIALKYLYKF